MRDLSSALTRNPSSLRVRNLTPFRARNLTPFRARNPLTFLALGLLGTLVSRSDRFGWVLALGGVLLFMPGACAGGWWAHAATLLFGPEGNTWSFIGSRLSLAGGSLFNMGILAGSGHG